MTKSKVNLNRQLIISVSSIIILSLLAITAINIYQNKLPTESTTQAPAKQAEFKPEVTKTEAEWKEILTPQQFYVLREKGTDIPFSETELLNEHRKGTFVTADCGEPVFRSETKFDSKTGWPSFWEPIEGSIVKITDYSLGVKRTEIVGKKCGGHLGHVFDDGPAPTGLRYCINSSALKFIPDPV